MTPERIVIHCTDTPNGKNVSLEAIKKDHIARGFGGIGYHFIIQADGTVVETRPVDQVGCHVAGHNTGSVGISLAGSTKFTGKQFQALRLTVNKLQIGNDLEPWVVYCHNQFDTAQKQGKTCPAMEINRLLLWYACRLDEAIEPYLLKENE